MWLLLLVNDWDNRQLQTAFTGQPLFHFLRLTRPASLLNNPAILIDFASPCTHLWKSTDNTLGNLGFHSLGGIDSKSWWQLHNHPVRSQITSSENLNSSYQWNSLHSVESGVKTTWTALFHPWICFDSLLGVQILVCRLCCWRRSYNQTESHFCWTERLPFHQAQFLILLSTIW